MSDLYSDAYYMGLALEEARLAYDAGEVPVGACLVHEGKVLCKAHNLRESKQSPTAHAELLAIEAASLALKSWRLEDCTLFVTLEPCLMCTGALYHARIKRLVYAAKDPKAGAIHSILSVESLDLHHAMAIEGGVLETSASALLKAFFQERRKANKALGGRGQRRNLAKAHRS